MLGSGEVAVPPKICLPESSFCFAVLYIRTDPACCCAWAISGIQHAAAQRAAHIANRFEVIPFLLLSSQNMMPSGSMQVNPLASLPERNLRDWPPVSLAED